MNPSAIQTIQARLVAKALAGAGEGDLLLSFCREACLQGLPVGRCLLVVDTLHPTYEGRVFRWRNDGVEEDAEVSYGRTDEGEAAVLWQASVFYHLLQRGESELRRCFVAGDPADFEHMGELFAEGYTDYVAFILPFGTGRSIGDLDGIYCYFATREPAGFGEEGMDALRRLLPTLGLAIKCASYARIASTIVEVYLGRDARERVLHGRISRGIAERIETVLWFSDLHGFTRITDTAEPGEIIPLLNDYSGAVIDAVHGAGGDVLKLIGDGVLAIFAADDPAEASRAALGAEKDMRRRVEALTSRRAGEGRPVTEVTLGLHIGDVLFGNIGADDRLDFTVVGPAVNEVSRIASLCRSVDRLLLVSAEFTAATPEPARSDLVSVGRYALRGVGRAEHLYTIDPALLGPVPSEP